MGLVKCGGGSGGWEGREARLRHRRPARDSSEGAEGTEMRGGEPPVRPRPAAGLQRWRNGHPHDPRCRPGTVLSALNGHSHLVQIAYQVRATTKPILQGKKLRQTEVTAEEKVDPKRQPARPASLQVEEGQCYTGSSSLLPWAPRPWGGLPSPLPAAATCCWLLSSWEAELQAQTPEEVTAVCTEAQCRGSCLWGALPKQLPAPPAHRRGLSRHRRCRAPRGLVLPCWRESCLLRRGLF